MIRPTEEQLLKASARFNNKYTVNGDQQESCWTWTGAKNIQGYGVFSFLGKNIQAHRFSFLLYCGEIKKEMICHKCDNPSCVNPFHLFEGTRSDNMTDAGKKGRLKNNGHYQHRKRCSKGHEYTEETTYFYKNGHRCCRICRREWDEKRRNKRRTN